jgi:hypothetical protein
VIEGLTVGCRHPLESPFLHGALKALSNALGLHINQLPGDEMSGSEGCPWWQHGIRTDRETELVQFGGQFKGRVVI